MEMKTQVEAEDGKQEILIFREFDLPVDLVFKAYTESEFLEQWMGTKVIKLVSQVHGSYQFETSDPEGNVVFRANGTIHDLRPNSMITRTFQMHGFPAHLEFLDFEALTETTSRLAIHMIFRTVEDRDQLLKLPFAYGLSMAHDKLQEILSSDEEEK